MAKNCSVICAKEDMFHHFFKNDSKSYGPSSFHQFNKAFSKLTQETV